MPAVRVDPSSGAQERLEHVATPRGRLYSWSARPPRATSCVLVCSSAFADFSTNYDRERAFGQLMAARGHGVVRFHYAGEGNSQGERRDMTLSSMCDDALAVLDHAASQGFTRFGVLGTRIGALVAAATSSTVPSAPLALWEPVHEPQRFLLEGRRADRISRTIRGAAAKSEGWREELERCGKLDLVGHDVYAPMVYSLEQADLVAALGIEPRPIFLARFRTTGANDALRDRLFAAGHNVDLRTYALAESWWFHDEQVHGSGDLVIDTVDWLHDRLAEVA